MISELVALVRRYGVFRVLYGMFKLSYLYLIVLKNVVQGKDIEEEYEKECAKRTEQMKIQLAASEEGRELLKLLEEQAAGEWRPLKMKT